MKKKSYAVIGLGQFGMSVATTLAEANCDVLAIDCKEELVQEISEKVAYAVKADVKEAGILHSLGVQNVDVAIVAVAEELEASITAVMQAKDLNVPYVMAKAMNELHGRILEKIGADKVIYPEKNMGNRVAKNLLTNGVLDVFELSSEFGIAEFKVPTAWVGKTLMELSVRDRYNINIIAIRDGSRMMVSLDPDSPLQEQYSLIAIGKNKDLNDEIPFINKK